MYIELFCNDLKEGLHRVEFYIKLAVPGHALLWPFPVTD
jgi:hypothetical protein